MCKGKRVEEDEVQESRGIRKPGTDIPGNGKEGEVCPANWQEGEEAMKPTAEGVATYLAKHGK